MLEWRVQMVDPLGEQCRVARAALREPVDVPRAAQTFVERAEVFKRCQRADQHAGEAPFAVASRRSRSGGSWSLDNVIGTRRCARDRRRGAAARRPAAAASSCGPAASVGRPAARRRRSSFGYRVHVFELESRLFEILAQARRRQVMRSSVALRSPVGRDRLADASQHDVSRDGIELHVAPAGRNGKSLLDLRARPRGGCRRAARGSADRIGTRGDGCRRSRAPCRAPCHVRVAGLGRAAAGTASGFRSGEAATSVSTLGTSTPSLNRSTVKTTLTRPAARSRERARSLLDRTVAPDRHGRNPALR